MVPRCTNHLFGDTHQNFSILENTGTLIKWLSLQHPGVGVSPWIRSGGFCVLTHHDPWLHAFTAYWEEHALQGERWWMGIATSLKIRSPTRGMWRPLAHWKIPSVARNCFRSMKLVLYCINPSFCRQETLDTVLRSEPRLKKKNAKCKMTKTDQGYQISLSLASWNCGCSSWVIAPTTSSWPMALWKN